MNAIDESVSEDQRSDAERLLEITRTVATELHPQMHLDESGGLDQSLDADFGLDSLARAELIQRIESKFGLELPDALLSSAETPRDLLYGLSRTRRQAAVTAAAPLRAVREVEGFAQATSLIDVLQQHLDRRPDQIHIRLLSEEAEEEITYRDLDIGARRVAAGILQSGARPGETIAMMLPTCSDYFLTFFGVIAAGAIPVPMYPPARPTQIEDHLTRHAGILRNAEATLLISVGATERAAHLLKQHVPSIRTIASPAELSSHGELPSLPPCGSEQTAFLQYTSGSTGNPKGVVLTHGNLLANLRAIGKAIHPSADDVVVSWLPLYHDMGLIGTWLGSFYYAFPLISMSPLHFLARPSRWLRTIDRFRATISAAPNFAYELCATKVPDSEIEGLDLSSWRMATNGAEAVSVETIRRFTARYAPLGFRPEAMAPTYGLAECSVALTIPPLGRAPLIERVSRQSFTTEGIAVVSDEPDALQFVGCGEPLPDHEVRVVGVGDIELPERREGRIQFRGPSATKGYYRNEAETRRMLHGEWLDSGDLGYLAGRELFVTGRAKDVIIRAGRHIYPQEIEEAAGNIAGVRKGCVAVFGSRDAASETERVIVVAETREKDRHAQGIIETAVRTAVLDACGIPPDEVVLAAPYSVLKTSSGKIRHRATADAYASATLGQPPPVWRQLARLERASLRPRLIRMLRFMRERMYAWYALGVTALAAPLVWSSIVSAPRRNCQRLLQRESRALLRILGIGVVVSGTENLPPGPCIFAVNHASYLDGVIVSAVLPSDATYVVKKEFARRFIARTFFSRIGSMFVERFQPKGGVEDTEQLDAAAHRGKSLVIFPEATFGRMPGLLPFRTGAFLVAARAGLPIVPVTLRGTRAILRGDEWFPRHGSAEVIIGEPIVPIGSDWAAAVELRQKVRAEILTHCGEPDLERPLR